MSRWFRHYEGMVDDPKLYVISRKVGLPWPHIAFVWSLILESAARLNQGGVFELNSSSVAIKMECTTMEVDSILMELEAEHMIEKRRDVSVTSLIVTAVTKWKERQFEGDKSAERMRKMRERRKANPQSGNDKSGSSRDASGDAAVTSRDAPETYNLSTVEGSLRSPSTSERKDKAPGGATPVLVAVADPEALSPADAQFYRRCKEVLGDKKGGMMGTRLLRAKKGVHAVARAAIEIASTKADPEEYVWAVIRGRSEEEKADRNWIDPRLGA